MTPKARVTRFVRRARRGVFLVAMLYAVAGLYFMYRASIAGQVGNTIIGLLFVAGVLGVTVVLRYLLDAAVWWISMWQECAALADRITVLERRVGEMDRDPAVPVTMDLGGPGRADPRALVAGMVPNRAYPRLVGEGGTPDLAGEGKAPVHADGAASHRSDVSAPAGRADAPGESTGAAGGGGNGHEPRAVNSEEVWRAALCVGDVATCRRILAAGRSGEDGASMRARRAELAALSERLIRRLKDEFTAHVRRAEYAEALHAGRRLAADFPNTRAARDFTSIEPVLRRRLTRHPNDEPALTRS